MPSLIDAGILALYNLTMRKPIAFILTAVAFGLQGMAAEADFAKSVQSVLEARCIDCHGSKKQKGDLRLDSLKDALSVVKPGESGESELFKRITLPSDHEDVMPPKGNR